jgi:hypothetical protein
MELIKESLSRIFKSFHGWEGETFTTVKESTFKITTIKSSSGRIVSSAHKGIAKKGEGYSTFMVTDMFQSRIELISQQARATEKTISEQHSKAVLKFDEMVQNGEITVSEVVRPKVGSILFTDGYEHYKGSKGNKHVVYEIDESGNWGTEFLTVEIDTLKLNSYSHSIKPISEKFGIGTYFEPGYEFKGSLDDINNLVIKAKELEAEEKKQREAEAEINKQIRLAKIEEGKKLISIPKWAKTVIVADLYEDKSDGMTDYFATSIETTNFLAFSASKRNNMKELYKACENWEGAKDLLTAEDTEEYTHGHTYLPDYYIGSPRWFGWKINKRKYFDLSIKSNKEALYIAASEGRVFIPQETKTEPLQNTPSDIYIKDYSEKAIVVRGDTKPIKDHLKSLGGRFNFRLKGGAGWIFPKTRKNEIMQALQLTA